MMRKIFLTFSLFVFSLVFFTSCGNRQQDLGQKLTSIQIIDRNGFKETVNAQDRLSMYEKVNFLTSQPYTKVTRIYARNDQGKTISRMTSYHENGELWQYLDVINGRACGTYREWHSNGQIRLDVAVMEGLGDLGEEAQVSWIFDGMSRAWDAHGHLLAEIYYDKGMLEGNAFYYYCNGKISKLIPYERDEVNGDLILYDEKGGVKGKIPFRLGKRHGVAAFKGDEKVPPQSEEYQNDLLIRATYHDFFGDVVAKIQDGKGKKAVFEEGKLVCLKEYQNGVPEGKIEFFDAQRHLFNSYVIKEGIKHGAEWVYFLSKEDVPPRPKLYLEWYDDMLHGICRSWYSNGTLESEREMCENKKQGISSAWYHNGSLMLIEEYEHDTLLRGTYMKRGDSTAVSFVENGEGTATLYDPEGFFLKRIKYKKGQPIDESQK